MNLEVIEFNDYVQPNLALDSGDIDANYFQTIPYLEEMEKQHKLNLHILVSVHLEPMALYSKTVKNLADIPNGAKIAIPSDPTNEGRALKVLEHAGLIKLKDGATLLSSPADIVENPKNLKFLELEPALLPRALDDVVAAVINANYALEAGFNPAKNALALENPKNLKFLELEPALLPRALDDVVAAVINANYALEAGFNPAKNALALEEKTSPFGNVVAVRENDLNKEAFQKLKKAITSPEVKKFIEEKYQGGVLPVF